MEEDIKKLEEFIKCDNIFIQIDKLKTSSINQALENLIKGYRELEEKQQSYNIAYNKGKAFEKHKWKSKAKEKIEEINQEKLNYSEDEWYLESEIKAYAIEKLQELMEDK